MQSVRTVPCPHCGKPAPLAPQNEWRPFCSERCKMIDLGAWASEAYRVPDPAPPTEDENGGS
ncbi:MAG TPA: DNA gyrase inhibitor YacG [Burkholderiales bacterium]|nr:DNA gyrase inhibitor YacG [Burkholderiales bacterium]